MNDFKKKDNLGLDSSDKEYSNSSEEINNENFITENPYEEKTSNKKVYIVAAVVILLIISLGVLGYFYLNSDSYNGTLNTEDNKTSESESNESSEDNQDVDNDDNNSVSESNSENQVSSTETVDEKQEIISLTLDIKEVVENKDVEQFRNYAGDLVPEGTTDEEILEQFEMFGFVFGDITRQLLESDNANFDFQGDTAIFEIEISYDEESDFTETQSFYYMKENGEWVFTDSETIDVLRAKPLDNISEEISIEPNSQEIFNHYQLSIDWAEGMEGRILLNNVEVFEEDGEPNSSSRNLGEKILNKDGDNTIDLSITSVSDDLGSLFDSDAFIEIVIYAVDEQSFPSEDDELVKISVTEPQENNIRYKFKLGQ